MSYTILGSSPAIEYQLIRFSEDKNCYKEDILYTYITQCINHNIQLDFAYLMCLLYTDFFTKPIEGNNIVGIGTQLDGSKMETFETIEDCIIAQCEILRKGCDSSFGTLKPHSTLYLRTPVGKILTRESAYEMWDYDNLTSYTLGDLNQLSLEIQKYDRENVHWKRGERYYYYIVLASSKSRSVVLQKKSELVDLGFDKSIMRTTSKDGLHFLEMGEYSEISNINILIKNLRMYGYSGEVKFKRIK